MVSSPLKYDKDTGLHKYNLFCEDINSLQFELLEQNGVFHLLLLLFYRYDYQLSARYTH